MGEFHPQGFVHQLLIRIHPFRKFIWVLCALSILLALLIILNSIFIIITAGSALNRVGDTSFIIFSEVLAWLLLLMSAFGLKLTFMAKKLVETAASRRNGTNSGGDGNLPPSSIEMAMAAALEMAEHQRRPFSAPNWIVPYSGWPIGFGGGDGFDLPGSVLPANAPPFDPFLFPPPPPRYSSLAMAPVVVPPPMRRASHVPSSSSSAAVVGLFPIRSLANPPPSSHHPSLHPLHPVNPSSSSASSSHARSPPPPYCPPPG